MRLVSNPSAVLGLTLVSCVGVADEGPLGSTDRGGGSEATAPVVDGGEESDDDASSPALSTDGATLFDSGVLAEDAGHLRPRDGATGDAGLADAGSAPDASRADTGPPDAGAVDDTFGCLGAGTGPIERRSGNYGYSRFRPSGVANGTRFDARGGRWSFQTYPTALQAYPIDVRGARDVCWAGGIVVGTNPLSSGWGETYGVSNGAGFITGVRDSPGFIVDGVRMHNVWDGVRPRSANFTVTNVWMSHIRDDCIENDRAQSGLVEDSLFDGCYAAFSSRFSPGAGGAGPSTAVWTIRDNLVRLEPMPKPHRGDRYLDPGHAMFFKWTSIADVSTPSPRLRLIGNVFLAEQPANSPASQMSVPASVVECRDNVLVWLGAGDYPGDLRGCFRVTRDRSVWDTARAEWIRHHPQLDDLGT